MAMAAVVAATTTEEAAAVEGWLLPVLMPMKVNMLLPIQVVLAFFVVKT
jgi:hypothetical protein